MNRQIKFRVWDNKYKCWMQGDNWGREGVTSFIAKSGKGYPLTIILANETLTGKIHEEIPFNGKNPRWEVCQFTGMKDKDGKEIFENDVVKVKRCHTVSRETSKGCFTVDLIEDGEAIGYVFWSSISYRYCVSFEHIRYDDTDDLSGVEHRHEVIGDYFTTPLFKGKTLMEVFAEEHEKMTQLAKQLNNR